MTLTKGDEVLDYHASPGPVWTGRENWYRNIRNLLDWRMGLCRGSICSFELGILRLWLLECPISSLTWSGAIVTVHIILVLDSTRNYSLRLRASRHRLDPQQLSPPIYFYCVYCPPVKTTETPT